ncbi:MAG: glutathione S-transferase family protein [Planctomycetes bacterium]|nr:glutathione S-transferase family protein [Planctomycetota bacterium]
MTQTSTAPAEFPQETDPRGAFQRQVSRFRQHVTTDGSSGFRAEPGRYHLYVSLACPWAHRTIIVRKLKGLEDVIGLTIVDPLRDHRGWAFSSDDPDPNQGFEFLEQAYLATDPKFEGRVTVPVLWDTQRKVVVNNESSEILRMLNSEFDEWGEGAVDFYPQALREEIDALNDEIYRTVNNGVYRAGFATTQEAYEVAVSALFGALERLEIRLGDRRYLTGPALTEADWRLFTTLIRFDAVYYSHFKCNLRRLIDFPNLWSYTCELYRHPGVAETVDFDHIKRHYFVTHRSINPTGIVPLGPVLEFDAPKRQCGT